MEKIEKTAFIVSIVSSVLTLYLGINYLIKHKK